MKYPFEYYLRMSPAALNLRVLSSGKKNLDALSLIILGEFPERGNIRCKILKGFDPDLLCRCPWSYYLVKHWRLLGLGAAQRSD